jgi:hypothetical protein
MFTPNGARPSWAAGLAIVIAAAASVAAGTLTITPDMNPAPAGVTITFVIAPTVRNQGDTVTFDFGDGGSGKIEYAVGCSILGGCDSIKHPYAGAGIFNVRASGTIGGASVSGSVQITITSSTAEQEIFVPTGAHLKGFNNVNWRTDLEVNNPGTRRATFAIALLLRDQDNGTPIYKTAFTLDPGVSARYNDLLFTVFGFSGAAAIRITPVDGTIIVTSRTYNQLPSGTFGQSVPAIPRAEAIGFSQRARLIGVSHDPTLASGYRTNLGFVNASPASIHVEAEFWLATGGFLGRTSYDLPPLGFRQIDKAFQEVTSDLVSDGYIIVRTTTAGARFFAYAVVTDNITGDPTYVDALIPE